MLRRAMKNFAKRGKSEQSFYGVRRGRQVGVFTTWETCKSSVLGYGGAEYKRFPSNADAESFVNDKGLDASPDPCATSPVPHSHATIRREISFGNTAISTPPTLVYTDGSLRRGRGSIGVYFGPRDPRNVSELSEHCETRSTSNRAELGAIIRALRTLREEEPGCIYTDSMYAIVGLQNMQVWKQRGWKLASGGKAQNKDIWLDIERLLQSRPGTVTRFVHVKGHANCAGNRMADSLAARALKRRQGTAK